MFATLTHRKNRSATRRLIVVIDDPCTAPQLCASVRNHTGAGQLEICVVAPAHDLPATQWYVDEEASRADAMHRLRTCMSCLRKSGVRVRAELGDADPVQAIRDALVHFEADEILIVTAPRRPVGWLQPNVIERARKLGLPLTHIVMPPRPVGLRS